MANSATPTPFADITELFKQLYTILSSGVNPRAALKSQFSKLTNAGFTGKKWIFAVKVRIGGGAANVGGGYSLPQATIGAWANGEVAPVQTYTRFGLTGMEIAQSKSNRGAFKAALAAAMEDRMQAHDKEVNRQLFCAGNGVLTTIPTGAASATQTPGTGTGGNVGDYGVVNGGNGTTHVNVGDTLAFYQSDGTSYIGTKTVVSKTSTTFTVDSTITSTNGAIVTRATADTDNITAGEAQGLLAACQATGALETIDPATVGSAWAATVLSNSGTLRDISNPLVMQALATIEAQSLAVPDLFVTSPGIVLKWSEVLLPLQRIDGLDAPLKGGYKPVAAFLNGGAPIPVISDIDCPKSRLFLLTTSTIQMADLLGTEWMDDDGSMLFRIVGVDGVEAVLRKYWQPIYTQRNALGVVEDINDIDTIAYLNG